MEVEIITALIENIAKEFNEHISIDNNDKILFSGKFGNGKSTFLKEFFKSDSTYQDEYLSIHISPVCYSVSSNEDVFSYIKYDILTELLKHSLELETRELNLADILPVFVKEKREDLMKLGLTTELLEFIPKLGKPIKLLAEILVSGSEKIKAYTNEINSQSEDNIISSFMNLLEKEKTIYENDSVTKIIEKLIEELQKGKKKKLVLVIDDLDRIDAEHIFRMLNVFSSQLDNYERFGKMNKFGFGKIILVCDINNIQSIYEHKFGARADFAGYIDKLFSKSVFEFSNYERIYRTVNSQINATLVKFGLDDFRAAMHLSWQIGIGFKELVSLLIQNNLVSYRDFNKLINEKFKFENSFKLDGVEINSSNHIFHFELSLLKRILLNYENVIKAINRLKTLSSSFTVHKIYLVNIIYLLTARDHYFVTPGNGYQYYLKEKCFVFDKLAPDSYPDVKSFGASIGQKKVEVNSEDYCELLIELLKKAQANGI